MGIIIYSSVMKCHLCSCKDHRMIDKQWSSEDAHTKNVCKRTLFEESISSLIPLKQKGGNFLADEDLTIQIRYDCHALCNLI